MERMSRKQIEALKNLVHERTVEHDRASRQVMEEFVEAGLAFKNKATRRVEAKGEKRSGFMKYVPFVFYTPSPAACKLAENIEEAEPKSAPVTNEARQVRQMRRSKASPKSADLNRRVSSVKVIAPKTGISVA